MTEAQQANNAHLGGHAQRAKELLEQANQEVALAAEQADANQGGIAPPPASFVPANGTGSWTICAYNVREPGSSLKEVQLFQNRSVITGTFKGPYQKGKLQGWINENHVEFSTDTHEVLTFRGEMTLDGMSGLYGVNGEHAQWKAQRN